MERKKTFGVRKILTHRSIDDETDKNWLYVLGPVWLYKKNHRDIHRLANMGLSPVVILELFESTTSSIYLSYFENM